MPLHTLRAILACGDELAAALEADDIDRVTALAVERGSLIADLLGGPPLDGCTAAADMAAALSAQHRVLAEALTARSAETTEALDALAQHRRARASYEGGEPVSRILRPVHG